MNRNNKNQGSKIPSKNRDLSYYGLNLLSYLKESHPRLASDMDFIKSRAEEAAESYSNAIKDGLNSIEAGETANLTLFRGLLFSKHDTLVHVLWNEFADVIPQSEAKYYAIRMQPGSEDVFAGYELSDEFMYSPEYDKLYTELTGFIDIWLEEHEL